MLHTLPQPCFIPPPPFILMLDTSWEGNSSGLKLQKTIREHGKERDDIIKTQEGGEAAVHQVDTASLFAASAVATGHSPRTLHY